jgi:NTE family protein
MASTAIPIFFPSIKIDDRYFGDGCLRNMAPLSPAIHLGAEKIFLIKMNNPPSQDRGMHEKITDPSLGRILSEIIKGIFHDTADADLEKLNLINKNVVARQQRSDAGQTFRHIEVCSIEPSENLSDIALELSGTMPLVIRHMLGILGSVSEAADLYSYLLFEPAYCQRLIELGCRDCLAKREEIAAFIQSK